MGVKDAIPVPMEKVDVAGSDFFIRKLIGELTWVLGHL